MYVDQTGFTRDALMELRYRPDIDGLRAVAVLAVVFFHYGVPGFSGGFAGVDIFFVISGYLITALISADMAQGRFTLMRFYEKRARRILPALFVLLIATTIVATLILFPNDFRRYAGSALATVFFSSNFEFWRVTGYFDVAAIQKPLLHTWSLGVEEQFYLLFPAILLGLRHFGHRGRLFAIGGILFASLGLAIWGVRSVPDAAFYLAPFRFWELMIGAMLALGLVPAAKDARIANAASLAGAAAVTVSLLGYSHATLFPGEAALLPCVGTALIVYGGAAAKPLVNRALSLRPVVFVGLISYSLYLWHWPVHVFARYYLYRDLTPAETAICMAASFALAILSWRFVERPFRHRRNGISRRGLFAATAVAMTGLTAFSTAALASRGWPERFRPAIRQILFEEHDTDGLLARCFARPLAELNARDLCQIGTPGEITPSFVLWGDSHADAILPAVEHEAQKNHLRGYFAGESSCAPLMGVFRPDTPRCKAFNEKILQLALRPEIKTVILEARWGKNADGRAYGDEGDGFVPLSDDTTKARKPSDNAAIFTRGLNRTVDALLAAGKHVVLIGSVPEVGWPVPQVLARIRLSGDDKHVFVPRKAFEHRQRVTLPLFHELAKQHGVTALFPQRYMCGPKRCRVAVDGRPLYRDEHHLSVFGAHQLEPMVAGIFDGQNG